MNKCDEHRAGDLVSGWSQRHHILVHGAGMTTAKRSPCFLVTLRDSGPASYGGICIIQARTSLPGVVVQSGGNSREAFGMQGDTSLVLTSQG